MISLWTLKLHQIWTFSRRDWKPVCTQEHFLCNRFFVNTYGYRRYINYFDWLIDLTVTRIVCIFAWLFWAKVLLIKGGELYLVIFSYLGCQSEGFLLYIYFLYSLNSQTWLVGKFQILFHTLLFCKGWVIDVNVMLICMHNYKESYIMHTVFNCWENSNNNSQYFHKNAKIHPCLVRWQWVTNCICGRQPSDSNVFVWKIIQTILLERESSLKIVYITNKQCSASHQVSFYCLKFSEYLPIHGPTLKFDSLDSNPSSSSDLWRMR